jgi:hypothetical protein
MRVFIKIHRQWNREVETESFQNRGLTKNFPLLSTHVMLQLCPVLRASKWPRGPFTARMERALFYRARSASKKDTWPLPVPSKLARYLFSDGG